MENGLRTDLQIQTLDGSCKEIFKGWNCLLICKSNASEIAKWRWRPSDNGCELPPFYRVKFLKTYRDTNIGFVGDALNKNMFASPFCTLIHLSSEVKKWRPSRADRVLQYNLTVAYHRTNLLARYCRLLANSTSGKLEALGYKEGYRIDVDVPEGTWAKAPSFHDILICNAGHW